MFHQFVQVTVLRNNFVFRRLPRVNDNGWVSIWIGIVIILLRSGRTAVVSVDLIIIFVFIARRWWGGIAIRDYDVVLISLGWGDGEGFVLLSLRCCEGKSLISILTRCCCHFLLLGRHSSGWKCRFRVVWCDWANEMVFLWQELSIEMTWKNNNTLQ